MSELRHDPLSRRWVIIAGERSDRPHEFLVGTPSPSREGDACPFCEGNEADTPPEILAYREGTNANERGWKVRVVPNRYPALAIEGLPDRRGVGVYDRMHGIGAHEVIVESPRHDADFSDLDAAQQLLVLKAWRERIVDLMRDRRFKYILLFKNYGSAAGALLEHPHAQIIATPVTPRAVAVELESSRTHHDLKERCLWCDVIAQEMEDGRRIVTLTDEFVAYTPYASRFPFEVLLAPRRHRHSFERSGDEELPAFAQALSDVLRRMKTALGGPPYNFAVHTAPNTNVNPRRATYFTTLEWDWHWHVEIYPRLTRVAGFEFGSGFHINPTPPEEAARVLRETELT